MHGLARSIQHWMPVKKFRRLCIVVCLRHCHWLLLVLHVHYINNLLQLAIPSTDQLISRSNERSVRARAITLQWRLVTMAGVACVSNAFIFSSPQRSTVCSTPNTSAILCSQSNKCKVLLSTNIHCGPKTVTLFHFTIVAINAHQFL